MIDTAWQVYRAEVIVAQGFKTAETLKLWKNGTILYSIKDSFQTLDIYTGNSTGGKNRWL
jgi:hypothetical protein